MTYPAAHQTLGTPGAHTAHAKQNHALLPDALHGLCPQQQLKPSEYIILVCHPFNSESDVKIHKYSQCHVNPFLLLVF
jgi:hypothetical protein